MSKGKDKFKAGIEKYKKHYKLNKKDFNTFIRKNVELSDQKCDKFNEIMNQKVSDNFTHDDLIYLTHLLCAYQTGQNIQQIQDEQLVKYKKLRYKDRNKNTQNQQKSQLMQQNHSDKQKVSNKEQEIKLNVQSIDDDAYENEYNKGNIENQQQIKDDDQQQSLQTQHQARKRQEKKRKEEEEQKRKQEEKRRQQQEIKQKQRREEEKREIYKKRIQEMEEKQKKMEILKQKEKEPIKKKTSAQSNKSPKGDSRLNTIEEQKTDEINLYRNSNNEKQQSANIQQPNYKVLEYDSSKELVDIIRFEKMGQDLMNPVIKYQIVYKNKFYTWRRYSEIEKLLTYLRFKYEGIVLPEMPPKEGIKGNLVYFWKSGVNQHFLEERKERLKQVLNRVMSCEYVCKDQVLIKFLQDGQYQLPNARAGQSSYLETLVGLKDILFNYNELKDYGMAYYNYITDTKKTINTQCSQQFEKIQPIITTILSLNQHKNLINSNFQKRRDILYDSDMKPKGPIKTNFDRILEEAQVQCHDLTKQYGRYLQLKSTQGWENELIKQKSSQQGRTLEKIKQDHIKTVQRITKSQKNLLQSIKKFEQKNEKMLGSICKQLMEWRRKAHP